MYLMNRLPVHRFPHPEINAEKFNRWISKIGGHVATVKALAVYSNIPVCHKHLEDICPYVTFTILKEFKSILKHLKKCENNKIALKRKYIPAKKMTRTGAFEIVSSKMSSTAKLFCQMQASQWQEKTLQAFHTR